MDYLSLIKKDYKNVSDLVIKKIKDVYIIYLETLADQDKINNYILKIIPKNKIPNNIKELIPSPNIKNIDNYETLKTLLETGFSIIINKKQTIAVETKTNLSRSIDIPTTEATLYGPKEALIENIQTNTGLIKRRIKSNNLKDDSLEIGRYTKTKCSILYIDNIVKNNLVIQIKERLNKINIDGICDVGELRPYLVDDKKNVFPAIRITERPDVITSSLLKGKIAIILDNSPYALILPAFFADFINPISDDYSKSINVNFLKVLRFFCFFLSIITPGYYLAITTFNQETIPISLLINFQNQRMDVPFPALLECLIVLIICEILRESDIRFPSSYGSAISILGALVLGEAAVSAGIVSPIMIIVASVTLITSMIFTDTEVIDGLRFWRFLFLFIASIFGLYGIGLSIILLFINLCNYEILGNPYFYPLSPFDLTYIKETLFKMKNYKRSKYLSNNRIKGGK